MVDKLTAVLKHPEDTTKEETCKEPVITAAASRDIDRLKNVEQVKTKWAEKDRKKPDNAEARLAAFDLFPIPPVTLSAGYRPIKKNQSKSKRPQPETEKIIVAKGKILSSKPLKLATKPPIFYTIQVGAYKTKVFAEKMIHSLADKGYNAFMAFIPTKDKTPLYRVRVEKFADKKEARQLAQKLEHTEHLKNFIITQNPG